MTELEEESDDEHHEGSSNNKQSKKKKFWTNKNPIDVYSYEPEKFAVIQRLDGIDAEMLFKAIRICPNRD